MSPTRIISFEDDPRLALELAAQALASNEVIVFPTDTVYGLCAGATSLSAYREVFRLKDREPGKPLSVLAHPDTAAAGAVRSALCDDPGLLREFAAGQVTVVLSKEQCASIPAQVLKVQPGSLGVRCPADERTRMLLSHAGGMVWATSVNLTGAPPATNALEVMRWVESLGDTGPVLAVVAEQPLPGTPSRVVARNSEGWQDLRQA